MKSEIVETSPPLTEARIDEFELFYNVSIPPDYRRFLLEYNGGYPDPPDFRIAGTDRNDTRLGAVQGFWGIDTAEETMNLDYVLAMFHDRVPADFFPFARDPGGSLLCIAIQGANTGKVYFWDHEYEADEGEPPTDRNLYPIANSFQEFLDRLGEI